MKLFNDIYVVRLVIVFNLTALLLAFGSGCTATKISDAPESVNAKNISASQNL